MNPTKIHPSAIIDEGAQIGEGTAIWHFCHVMPKAVIGKNCGLGQNVFVADGVKVGNGCKIQNNVSLYSGVEIEDEVFLGPSCVFTNVINPRSGINRRGEYQKTLVKRGATIGANATVVCGVTLGQFSFVAAGAVVTRSTKDFALVAGVPAVQTGWMSHAGHRLVFDEDNRAQCPETGHRYELKNDQVSQL